MGNLFRYSGLTTKIKSMQSRMLTLNDYNEMAHMTTVKDVAIYLRNCPSYSNVLEGINENDILNGHDSNSVHRGQLENKLIFSMYKDYVKIYKFTNGSERRFLDSYFIYFEIEIIKVLLRMFLDSRTLEYNLSDFEKFFMEHSKIDIKRLSKVTNLNEFIECLKETDYYNILSLLQNVGTITLFDIEMQLNLYYFSMTWKLMQKYLTKQNKKVVMQTFGVRIDLLNIMWIYRAKTYYSVDKDIIYTYIIPIRYKLKRQQIKQMVEANDNEELIKAIQNTCYSDALEEYDIGNAEKVYFTIVSKLLKKATMQTPMSLAPVRYFMYYKETELANITKIIESIRYGLKPEEIIKYLDISVKNGVEVT